MDSNFAFCVAETAQAMRRDFDRRAQALGVTRAQWRVLTRLSRQDGLRQVELAEQLDVEPITLCRMIDRLSDAGLVERRADEEDRRAGESSSPPRRGRSSRISALVAQIFLEDALDGISGRRPAKGDARPRAGARQCRSRRIGEEGIVKEGAIAGLGRGSAEDEKKAPKAKKGKGRASCFSCRCLCCILIGRALSVDDVRAARFRPTMPMSSRTWSRSAPKSRGPIVEVAVKENQPVKKGDLLFRIDPAPYRIALAQAEAADRRGPGPGRQARGRKRRHRRRHTGRRRTISHSPSAPSAARQSCSQRGFTTRARYDEAQHAVQEAQRAARQCARGRARSSAPRSRRRQRRTARGRRRDRRARQGPARSSAHRGPRAGRRHVSQTERLQVGNAAVPGLPLVSLVAQRRASGSRPISRKPTSTGWRRASPPRSGSTPIPSSKIKGHVASIGARHRLRILGPPGAERQRQLGQGDPARARPDRDRRQSRRPLIAGLSARCHGRHQGAASRQRVRRGAAADAPAQRRAAGDPPSPLGRLEHAIVSIALMMAVLLQVLDTTIANVALPHMQASTERHPGDDQLGADQLYRRLRDRDADHRLARRPGRPAAPVHLLGRSPSPPPRCCARWRRTCRRWSPSAPSRASRAPSSCRSPRR